MTQAELQQILDLISYKDWELKYSWDQHDRWLQVLIPTSSIEPTYWYCRKWKVSPHMTRSELIQTVFMAIMAAEEHETREEFKYAGVAILGPHWDLSQLASLIEKGVIREDVRDTIQT